MAPVVFTPDYITQTPLVGEQEVSRLLESEYGISSARITPLTGYDDLNFLVEVAATASTDGSCEASKLVLKFSNPIEASTPGLMDSQIKLMEVLNAAGIPTPSVVPRLDGKKWATVQMTETVTAPMRLVTFLPGTNYESLLHSTKAELSSTQQMLIPPKAIYRCVGQLLARFHSACDGAECQQSEKFLLPFKQHRTLISFGAWEELAAELELLYSLKKDITTTTSSSEPPSVSGVVSEERYLLCATVFQQFREEVLGRWECFPPYGLIHTDINETNALFIVRPKAGGNAKEEAPDVDAGEDGNPNRNSNEIKVKGEWSTKAGEEEEKELVVEVSGLLDFGDTHYSLRLFDTTNTLCYLLLDSYSGTRTPPSERGEGEEDSKHGHDQRLLDPRQKLMEIYGEFTAGYHSVEIGGTKSEEQQQRGGQQSGYGMELIVLCIKARIVASLVYGLRTVRINYRKNAADAEYILRTQHNGWRMLKELCAYFPHNSRST